MKILTDLARFLGVWLTCLVAQTAAGTLAATLVKIGGFAAPGPEPLSSGQAMLLVTGAYAVVLSLLARGLPLGFVKKTGVLFSVLFGAGSLLSAAEAWFFRESVHFPSGFIAALLISGPVASLLASAGAAVIWRTASSSDASRLQVSGQKVALLIALYVILYSVAGYAIAWQSRDVRSFYQEGIVIAVPWLLLLQVARGAVWAWLAVLCARFLDMGRFLRAGLAGLSFAVFMAVPLLYPSAVMPWSVRRVHFVELVAANLLFGFLAVTFLTGGRRGTIGELSASS
jgi:hypothetical protein